MHSQVVDIMWRTLDTAKYLANNVSLYHVYWRTGVTASLLRCHHILPSLLNGWAGPNVTNRPALWQNKLKIDSGCVMSNKGNWCIADRYLEIQEVLLTLKESQWIFWGPIHGMSGVILVMVGARKNCETVYQETPRLYELSCTTRSSSNFQDCLKINLNLRHTAH